jgi:hypothetical protein
VTGETLWVLLLGGAVIVNGLLAGASLDQSIEQLPARHRIGVRAYLAYSRASHMANGRFWLIPLGIIGPVMSLVAAVWDSGRNLPTEQSLPVFLAAGIGVASILSTLRAGSINWALTPWQPNPQKVADDESALIHILQRFERWQEVRATVQFLHFAFAVWALAANSDAIFPR